MKTTYLVKKNPELPTCNENWIIMDGTQFLKFKESPEGKKRSNNFIKLCTEFDDECYVIECDVDKLMRWKTELNHKAYLDKHKQMSSITTVSYSQYTESDGEELYAEELFEDHSKSVEDTVIGQIEIDRLIVLMDQLTEDEKRLIYSFYFTDSPMTDTAYGRKYGVPRQTVTFKKERAIEKLKKLYFV